jgi:hypothetical protein
MAKREWLVWECLSAGLGVPYPTHRTPVPGGWLVLTSAGVEAVSTAFVPDPEHTWDGKSVPLPNFPKGV